MKRAAILALSALLLAGSASLPAAAAGTDSPAWSQAFDPARDPAADLAEAVKLAQASGRRILVDVGGDWCIWCHLLDGTFEVNPDLTALRDANYVLLKVHYDKKQNPNTEFLSRWPKPAGYPHLFVLDGDGSLLHSQNTGELELPKEQGKGHDPAAIRAFLEKWAPDTKSGA